MINRIKKDRKEKFSVLDIETHPEKGTVLDIALYDGKTVNYFGNWNSFLLFLKDNNEPPYTHIIAHYGGGFDFVSFIENQIHNIEKLEIITSGSAVILIEINDFEKKVKLTDSINVLQSSLDKLSETFNVKDKKLKGIDLNTIHLLKQNNPKLYYKYLKNDVISLFQIIKAFQKLLDIDFFPLTISQLSMYLFRKRFLDEKINLFSPDTKNDGKKDAFITESYAGGRVEVFRGGKHKKTYAYDLNSIYPDCMANLEVPISCPIYTKIYRPKKIGFYRVKFHQENKSIPALLWIKDKNGLEFTYKGEGVYSSIEIERAIELNIKLIFIEGIFYLKSAKIFNSFVTIYYAMRMKHKGSALDFIIKLILNSLYGKWAEKPESKKLVKIDCKTMKQNIKEDYEKLAENPRHKIKTYSPYIIDMDLQTLSEYREVRTRMVHISSLITSQARLKLYDYLLEYKDSLVYCDTDCIHLTKKMDAKYLGDKLGMMKLENAGRSIYLGRKQYFIGHHYQFKMIDKHPLIFLSNKFEKDVKKFKGVSMASKLGGDDLTYDDYVKMDEGKEINFSFNTFPKIKSVLKGRKACKKMLINKNIKRAKYFTNFLDSDN